MLATLQASLLHRFRLSAPLPFRKKVLFEALENRLLLSADPVASLGTDGGLRLDLSEGNDQVVIEQTGLTEGGGAILQVTAGGITERFGDQGVAVRRDRRGERGLYFFGLLASS